MVSDICNHFNQQLNQQVDNNDLLLIVEQCWYHAESCGLNHSLVVGKRSLQCLCFMMYNKRSHETVAISNHS